MKLRWWKKTHACEDQTEKIRLLKKELHIKNSEITLQEWKYNQLLERTLIENSKGDFA